MSLIIDAGGWIALERSSPVAWDLYRDALRSRTAPRTHGGVVGQTWRGGGPRQTRLARALDGALIVPLDDTLGRRAGALLARTRGRDVVDAALVLLARDGDVILTSDPDDLAPLAVAAGLEVDLVVV